MLENLFAEDEKQTTSSNTNSISKPSEPRASSGFVGLRNQGATCYLNSLIQAMYMTPELRFGLYSINPVELGSDIMDEYEKEKKADEKKGMIEADDVQLETMKSMGLEEIGSRKSLIATKNNIEEAMTYYWDHEKDANFNKETPVDESKRKKRKPRYIPLELQRLFTQLEMLNERAISTEDLTSRGFQWQGVDGRVQHDAHELNRLLIDALERSLKHTSGEKLSKLLYEGMLSNQIKCTGCHKLSKREELFYDLNIQIQNCPNLVHALRQYTAAEVMEGDSAYACDTCGSKQRALRSAVLESLPPVLTLSCNRFKYDKSTNWQREKILARSEFPLLLNMTDYKVANGSCVAGKPIPASDDVEGNLKLSQLKDNMVWIQDVWNTAQVIAADLLKSYGDDVSVDYIPEERVQSISKELCSVESYIESNRQRSIEAGLDPKATVNDIYQLFAVIMHRGSAHSGHYFAYIRDSLSQGNWGIPLSEYTSRFLSATAVQSGSGSGVSKGRDTKTYHYFDSANGAIVIDNTSVLSKLIHVFQTSHGSIGSNYKSISHFHLGKTFKATYNNTWPVLYKSAYGTMLEFLKKYEDIFIPDDETKSFSLQSSHKIVLIPPLEFAKLLESHLSSINQSAAKKSDVTTATATAVGIVDVIPTSIHTDTINEYNYSNDISASDGNYVVDTSSDEQLARQLSEMNDDGIEGDLVSVTDSNMAVVGEENAEEWHTLESKKSKNKKKVSSGDSNYTSSSSTKPMKINTNRVNITKSTSTIDKTESAEKSAEMADNLLIQQSRVYKLASELMNLFHGRYFEFNDSEVKAMPIVHLERAFEGRDSAYLLVYRKVTPPQVPVQTAIPKNTDTGVSGINLNYNGAPMDVEVSRLDRLGDEEDAVIGDNNNDDFVDVIEDDDDDIVMMMTDEPDSSGGTSIPSSTASGNPAEKKKSKKVSGDKQKANNIQQDVSLPPTNTVYLTEQNLAQVSNAASSSSSSALYGSVNRVVSSSGNSSSSRRKKRSNQTNVPTFKLVSPPVFWSDKVTVMNADLESARTTYETMKRSIKVQILCPYHVNYSTPYFHRNIQEFSFGDISDLPDSMKSQIELEVDNTLTVAELTNKILEYCNEYKDILKLTLKQQETVITQTKSSKRKSPSSAFLLRQSVASSDSLSILSNSENQSNTGSINTQALVLSELQSISDGLYPLEALQPDTILQKALSPSVLLLAWNGSTFDGSAVLTGSVHKPVPIKLSVLKYKSTISDAMAIEVSEGVTMANTRSKTISAHVNTNGGVTNNNNDNTVALPSSEAITVEVVEEQLYTRSTTILELCEDLYIKYKEHIKRPCFHLVNKQSSKTLAGPVILPTRTRSGNPNANPKSQSKGLLSQLLWQYVPNTKLPTTVSAVSPHLTKSRSSIGTSVKAGSSITNINSNDNGNGSSSIDYSILSLTIGDMIDGKSGKFSGDEILIEESDSSSILGLYSGWLADSEISRRNSTWTVTIEIEVSRYELDLYIMNDSKTVVDVDINQGHSDVNSKLNNKSSNNNNNKTSGTNGTIAIDLTVDDETPIQTKSSSSGSCPSSVTMEFLSTATLSTVKDTILRKIGLSDPKYVNITRFRKGILKGENVADDEEKSLAQFDLHDSCTLYLELGKLASSQKVTVHAASVVGNDISAIKVNPYQPGKRSSELVLDVSPVMTVRDLRDRLGCLFHNLTAGWTSASSLSSSAAAAAVAAVAASALLTNGQQNSTANPTSIQSSQSPHPSYRLRRTTILGDCDTLYSEVGNKGELLTLENVGITAGSLVLLEEGEVPVKGLLSFSVFLWSLVPFKPIEIVSETSSVNMATDGSQVDSAVANNVAVSNDNVSAIATAASTDATTANTVLDDTNMPIIDMTQDQVSIQAVETTKPAEIIEIERTRRQHLLPLGDLICHEDKLMSDLQSLVFKLIKDLSQDKRDDAFHDGIEPPADEQHILIRELRSDMLPGRCLWSCKVPKDTPQNMTGLGRVPGALSSVSPIPCEHTTSLKRLYFKGDDVKLAVELISGPQESIRPPISSIRIWAQILVNPYGAAEGESIMNPVWPPLEVTINGGLMPTIGFLKSQIFAKLWPNPTGTQNIIHVRLLKFEINRSDAKWTEINKEKKVDNIFGPPTSLKEGDLICAHMNSGTATVSRPEDKYLKIQKKAEIAQKKAVNVRSVSRTGAAGQNGATTAAQRAAQQKGKKQIVEVALSLGGNLDFSDDEDEENNDN